MQQISVYLYPNRIDVYTNVATWSNERYRKVYNRNLKAYGGVDNQINVQVRNQDQKPLSITGSTVVMGLIAKDSQELILEKDCTVVDDTTGKVYFTLTSSDLLDIEPGSYEYSLRKEVRNTINNDEYVVTSNTPLYSDSQYGVIGTIEVIGSVQGVLIPTTKIEQWSRRIVYDTSLQQEFYDSGIIDARPQYNTPQTLHTFQIYFTNFTGTLTLQGSISDSSTPSSWSTIETLTYTQASQDYYNLTGKYNWFRFRYQADTLLSGKVDKILYR